MNKYFWASLILIIISIVGLQWLVPSQTLEDKRDEAINAIYPTVTPVATSKPIVGKKTPTKIIEKGGIVTNKGGLVENEEKEETTQSIFKSIYATDRKLYIEKEYSGTRYVLWRSDSKITVHTGNSWSWVHPNRDLSQTGIVPGQKVFVYTIGSQKIVDFMSEGKKYTIQCVHNGDTENKAECEKFVSNFKLI